MYSELPIKIGNQNYTAFLQNGFYNQAEITSVHLHKHNYTEIHIISEGSATYTIGNKSYRLKMGNLFVIPRGTYHCCTEKDENTKISAFQLNYTVKSVSVHEVGDAIFREFFKEIDAGNYIKLSAYLTLFFGCFYSGAPIKANSIDDYAFLIYEFFSTNYMRDLRLGELADLLHLSQRQTERLVVEYTGKTFKEELAAIRMRIAENLLQTTNMSLGEVARYVGYQSYAGFWKAMKKHQKAHK